MSLEQAMVALPLDPVWAIEPMAWRQMLAGLKAHDGLEARIAALESPPIMEVTDGIAVIHITGVLSRRPSLFSLVYGGTSTEEIATAAQTAAADESVRGILLLVDSPGGSVAGLAEAGDALWAARKKKPVVAHVDGMAASAAYYLASQADKVYAQRMDLVGSIGARLLLYDYSKAFVDAGIEAVPIDTGEYKSAGAVGTEITEDQRAYFQTLVDAYFEDMMAAIARGRKMPRGKIAADGRVFPATAALELGLIDGIHADIGRSLKAIPKLAKAREPAAELAPELTGPLETETEAGNCEPAISATQEVSQMANPNEERTPATLEDLLSCLGKIDAQRDAAFVVEQLNAGATLDQARSAWEEELHRRFEESERARVEQAAAEEKPGVEPLGTGETTGGGEDPRQEWDRLVREEMGRGRDRATAVRVVARDNKGLREALVATAN